MMYPKDTAQPDKRKACKQCGSSFVPFSSTQTVCGRLCAGRLVKAQRKAEIQNTRARKEAIKTIPQLIRETQVVFNSWVRERDKQAGQSCISSGRPLDWSGNGVDAGHYRSTGAASHLRFNPDNCHAQSKMDNQFLSGNVVDYRIRLIGRIGLERVEALENNNQPVKWTAEVLRAIKAEYKAKLKALEAAKS